MANAPTPCSVIEVASESDFEKQTSDLPAEALVVIYFHAPWAAPCKQMSLVVATLAGTYQQTSPARIAFFSVHAEDIPEVSDNYDVSQVPYVVIQKAGQVVETVSGSDASKLRAAVEKHAGASAAQKGTSLPPPQQVAKQETDPAPSQTNGTNGTSDKPAADEQESKEELHARLAELVKAAPVMLFMKGTPSQPQCGFSRQTVGLLREHNIRYGFFNILADDDVRQGLKEFSDWPTFPQLYADGELVGGLDIVREEFENDPEFLNQHSVKPKVAAAT